MSRIPKAYEIYKHFKGNLYQVLNVAEHSETGEKLVIYQALYGEYKVYARPLESFAEALDKMKYPEAKQEFRFELINREEMNTPVHAGVTVETADIGHASEEDTKEKALNEETINRKVTNEVINEETEELHIDPMVMKFLDADTYEEKLQILVGLEHRITDEMITTMAIACDVEIPDGSTETRFQGLKNCLLTFDRFECNRLR